MKLIIQIPCYNEEESIALTLSRLPRELPGVDIIEWLLIDDGCTDRTVDVALEQGIDHLVRFNINQGLAKAFMAGLDASIEAGADIIVNTDADNQYNADDIIKLIEPILSGEAEFVVGARPISEIRHFSFVKKILQKVGSWVVRFVSKTKISDATSGFRAFSRDVAMRINIFSDYTYTLETIIQAGYKGILVSSVPIRTNDYQRPSRLITSTPVYISRSILTIIRIFITYRPFIFFMVAGLTSLSLGVIAGLRFLYYYLTGEGVGHIQSVIFSALLSGTGFFLIVVGMIADLNSVNRKLLEKMDWRVRKIEGKLKSEKPY